MKKSILLLIPLLMISCSKHKATSGNSGPIPGNSDRKIYHIPGENEKKQAGQEHDHATSSTFHFDVTKSKLIFTAYKLPGAKRTGVNGTFKVINVIGAKDSKKAEDVLSNTSFTIPVDHMSTNDVGRDQRIKDFFFKKMANTDNIIGKFGMFKAGKVPVTLTLNGKTVTKPFEYKIDKHEMTLMGKIDVIKDFSASVALKALDEACKVYHEGKTWSDVDLKAHISL